MVLARTFTVRRLSLALCILAILAIRPASAGVLILNTDGAPPHSRPDATGFEDRIVTEAFRRVGVSVRLEQQPSERALRNADAGVNDGTYVRIAGLEALYPHLVMVPEPVSVFPFAVFTREPGLKAARWSDLKGVDVASVTGWKLVEAKLAGVTPVRLVRDEESLFALLAAGRAQAVIAGLHTGRAIVHSNGYGGIRAITPPLASPPMYIYLHQRHVALAPRLAAALAAMRREGETQRLVRLGLGPVSP